MFANKVKTRKKHKVPILPREGSSDKGPGKV
jgi:hypothetical protein